MNLDGELGRSPDHREQTVGHDTISNGCLCRNDGCHDIGEELRVDNHQILYAEAWIIKVDQRAKIVQEVYAASQFIVICNVAVRSKRLNLTPGAHGRVRRFSFFDRLAFSADKPLEFNVGFGDQFTHMILHTDAISNFAYQVVNVGLVLGAHGDGMLDEGESFLELLAHFLSLGGGFFGGGELVGMGTNNNHGRVVRARANGL